jgi:hypothetical protein
LSWHEIGRRTFSKLGIADRPQISAQEQNENIRNEKNVGRRNQSEASGVVRKVGGIPIMSAAALAGRRCMGGGVCRGAVMARILNDVLFFACATLFVTGIVLAAAKLLI